MKAPLATLTVALSSAVAAAQTGTPPPDANLVNLTTTSIQAQGKGIASFDLRSFSNTDKVLRPAVALGYGLGGGLELGIDGMFGARDGKVLRDGTVVRYGGSEGDLVLRYAAPHSLWPTLEAGIAYLDTPAQPRRTAIVLGATEGISFGTGTNLVRMYLNPKAIIFDSNTLVGIGVGAAYDITPDISIIGDWTPLVAGSNAINSDFGTRQRIQLYGVALRFNKLIQGAAIDLGYTNSTGMAGGFSLTPGLGNTGAFYARATVRF